MLAHAWVLIVLLGGMDHSFSMVVRRVSIIGGGRVYGIDLHDPALFSTPAGMIDWATPLFSLVLDWHCIQWRFKSNEENAWDGTCTEAVVWSFRWTICISP